MGKLSFLGKYVLYKHKTTTKQLSTKICPINLSLKGNEHFALATSLLIGDDLLPDYSSFLKNKMKFMHVSKVYATYVYIFKK